ncbi:hypothetical protein HY345_02890 [Candidatus Microgenomates bacterium]|nr:hypothetical protein [Candidatus Microgenomates bacterium]
MYNLLSTQNVYLLVLLAIWEMIWKGMALWKAARNGQQFWFIVLLVINSLGILPILYLRFFSLKETGKKKV